MAPVRSWEAQVVSLVPALSEGSISSLIFFFFFNFWSHDRACGILAPQLGIKPMPPAMEA